MHPKQYIAAVSQGGFAKACGPYRRISHLGTAGLGPCVGVALVSSQDKQTPPIITMAHIGLKNDVVASLTAMRCEHASTITSAYIESGESRKQLEEIVAIMASWHVLPLVNKILPEKDSINDWLPRQHGV